MAADFDFFPFEEGPGSTITEARWKEMFTWMRTSGVLTTSSTLPTGSDLHVDAAAMGLAVNIETGQAIIKGAFWDHTGDPAEVTLNSNSSGDPRIDLIVLRADFPNDTMSYVAIEGTPDPSPVAPSPVQNSTVWDIPLAEVDVADSAVSLSSGDITDRRIRSVQGSGGSLPTHPKAYVYKDATTTGLADASTTTITFDTATLNPDSMWDSGTNPERITISDAGIYYIRASTGWVGVSLANGPVELQVVLNGTTTISRQRILLVGADTLYLNTDVFYSLSSSDYLELDVINDSGETLSLSSGDDGPSLQAIKIGS